jgi:hypothetical protein
MLRRARFDEGKNSSRLTTNFWDHSRLVLTTLGKQKQYSKSKKKIAVIIGTRGREFSITRGSFMTDHQKKQKSEKQVNNAEKLPSWV